jgi:hypothetical protein
MSAAVSCGFAVLAAALSCLAEAYSAKTGKLLAGPLCRWSSAGVAAQAAYQAELQLFKDLPAAQAAMQLRMQ